MPLFFLFLVQDVAEVDGILAATPYTPHEVAGDVGDHLAAHDYLHVQARDIGARTHEASIVGAHVPGEEQVARVGKAARFTVDFLVGAEDGAGVAAHVVAEVRVVVRFVLELHVVGLGKRERTVAELVEVACGNRAVLDGLDHFFAYAVVLQFLLGDFSVDDILEECVHVHVGCRRDVHDGIAARLDTALHVFFEQGEVIAAELLLVVACGNRGIHEPGDGLVGEPADGARLDGLDELRDGFLFGYLEHGVRGVILAAVQERRDKRVEACNLFCCLSLDEFGHIEAD